MGPNIITPKQSAHLNLILDEVVHAYIALSKSAVKSTSRSLMILDTSYSSASIGVSDKNAVQLPFAKTLTHVFIINQQLPLSPGNILVQCQLYCCCHVQDSWSSLPVCLAEESTSAVHHNLLPAYIKYNKIQYNNIFSTGHYIRILQNCEVICLWETLNETVKSDLFFVCIVK